VRLTISIPVVLFALAAEIGLSWIAKANPWWTVAVLIAAITAADTWLHGFSRYAASFPLHPAGTFIAHAFFWPIALPWYLRVRRDIGLGRVAPGPHKRSSDVAIAVLALLLAVALVRGVMNRQLQPLRARLYAVATAVAPRVPGASVNATLSNGSRLGIVVANRPNSDTATATLRALGDTLAHLALRTYPHQDSLLSVSVTFQDVSQRGMVTLTRDIASFTWFAAELRRDAQAGTAP